LAGEFIVMNKHLLQDLIDMDLWSTEMKDRILLDNGSIQNIDEIPRNIRNLYKTSWDLSQKVVIDHAAERAPYICQSQSLNLYMKRPDFSKLSSMHMYAWKKGLKTGMYYLRTMAVAKAQQVTIGPKKTKQLEEPEDCLMCGS